MGEEITGIKNSISFKPGFKLERRFILFLVSMEESLGTRRTSSKLRAILK